MKILGISAFYHDSAAALVNNGEVVAASQEERFSRVKHDNRFPEHAIDSVLRSSGIAAKDIDIVVFYENPEKKFDRVLSNAIHNFPRGFMNFRKACSKWVRNNADIRKEIQQFFSRYSSNPNWDVSIRFCDHHLSHAASAFYPSPFKESAVLTIDGVGEWSTAAIWKGSGNELSMIREINYPHSLGLLYSAFTQFLGFKVNSGEYKVMGLAPYGVPRYLSLIKDHLIDIYEDGSFRLNMKYFDFVVGKGMINNKFAELFRQPPRESESTLNEFHADVASSIQKVTEEIMLKLVSFTRSVVESPNLCLAGGVALNCVANGRILQENIFNDLWIQPAANDAGCALGAALIGSKCSGELDRRHLLKPNLDAMQGSYIGPEFSDPEIEERLINLGAKYTYYQEEVCFLREAAKHILENKVVGWFQGRMEFGPRALGARSILGNPMEREMQSRINLKIKYRESFRPFAPSVLSEEVANYFELTKESPYMLLVASIKEHIRLSSENDKSIPMNMRIKQKRSTIPAVTHVDFSARIHTVSKARNAKYYNLIKSFKKLSGCPVLINTSFNIRGEPIVCTPEDAYRCFMGTEMDVLAIGNFILLKQEQPNIFRKEYKDNYELD